MGFCRNFIFIGAAVAAASVYCNAADTYTQAEASRRVPAETAPQAQPADRRHESSVDNRSAGGDPQEKRGRQKGEWIPDSDALAQAVSKALERDPLVSLAGVEAEVDGSSVSLSGTVPTLIAKERATRLAETVPGVTAVKNDIVVIPTIELSANEIESAIRQALVANPATEAFQIRIEAAPDSRVVLTGEVDSTAERELVERVAQSVKGVAGIRNEIEVNYQASRTDKEIQREISRLLGWDAAINDRTIEVEVNDGRVVLSGMVLSLAEKRRAIGIASTAGSRSVDASKLAVTARNVDSKGRSVTSSTSLQDEEIAAAVRRFVSMEPLADGQQIDVEVDAGVVTLRGDVETLAAKRAFVSRVSDVLGVRDVRDRLNVRTSDESSQDRRIEKQVIAGLAANSLTEAYQISVGVNDGTVRLAGHVDSWFERDAADDVAANVRGVRSIENDLVVRRSDQRVGSD